MNLGASRLNEYFGFAHFYNYNGESVERMSATLADIYILLFLLSR